MSTANLTLTQPRRRILQAVDDQDNYVLQIDNSTLETYVTCPRSYAFNNIYGRSPEPKSALTFGSAIHRGLELYYKNRPVNEIIEGVVATFPSKSDSFLDELLGAETSSREWRTPELAVDTILEYMKTYPKECETWEVMTFNGEPAVEIGFSIPLMETKIDSLCNWPQSTLVVGSNDHSPFHVKNLTVFWTGKLDLLVRMRQSGAIKVLDHKTSSIASGQFLDDFILSQQTLGYTWAGREMLEEPVDGLILDLIVNRQPTRTGTARALSRYPYPYPEWRLDEWRTNVVSHIIKLLHDLFQLDFPMSPKWCIGKYGKCPYHSICSLPPEQRLDALEGSGFTDNTWSPLAESDTTHH